MAHDWWAYVWAAIYAVAATIHPHAAVGAAGGCCFFLWSPISTSGAQRVKLTIFSVVIGYAGGVFFYGDGPPYSPKAMLVAGGFAAFAAVVSMAFYHVVDSKGDLPKWLKSALAYIPFLKRQGEDDARP